MSSIASKLLMCVCAGGTGAAIVPVSKAVRNQSAPRHAAAPKRAAPMAVAAAAAPCAPVVADAGLTPSLAGLGGISPLLTLDSAPSAISPAGSLLGRPGDIGDILASSGSGGFAPGSGGSVGGGGGGGGGGGTGDGGTGPGGGLPPVASNAPEPTSWALMIGGFGLLGGAMRYTRRAAA